MGLQQICLDLCFDPRFDAVIITVIVMNCIALALFDPTKSEEDQSSFIIVGEYVFTLIFVVEFVIKLIGLGLTGYLSDKMNWLDGFVVMESVVSFILELVHVSGAVNISALRTLRVLRPLKTISFIPEMRLALETLLLSMEDSLSLILLIFLTLLLWSAAGYYFFRYKLRDRCFEKGESEPVDNTAVCGSEYKCESGQQCKHYGESPNDDATSFDSIFWALTTNFQVITLEGWQEVVWWVQDAVDTGLWIYFFAEVIVVNFVMINLFPAIMSAKLEKVEEMVKKEEERKSNRSLATEHTSEFQAIINTFEAAEAEDEELVQQINKGGGPVSTGLAALTVNENELPPYTPKCLGCAELRALVSEELGWFAKFIYFCIILNIIIIAMDGYRISDELVLTIRVFNIFFTSVFLLELTLKLGSLGPVGYFGDSYNVFDFVLVVLAVVELAGDTLGFFSALRVARLFRLARVMRLLTIIKISRGATLDTSELDLARIMGLVASTGIWIVNVFFFLCLFVFMFAILGMQLFGGRAEPGETTDFNFDSFMMSVATVFDIVTGNRWPDIMGEVVEHSSPVAVLYFVLWIALSRWFLLAILVAALFSRIEKDSLEYLKYSARGTTRAVYGMDHAFTQMWVRMHFVKWAKFSKRMGKDASALAAPVSMVEEEEVEEELTGIAKFLDERSDWPMWLIHPDGKMRALCTYVSEVTWFTMVVFFAIIISAVSLALEAEMESGAREDDDGLRTVLFAVEVVVTVIFVIEVFVKISAYAFIGIKDAYMHSGINILDFTITVISVVSIALDLSGSSGGALQAARAFRLIRCIRPFRVLARSESLRALLDALAHSGKSLQSVMFIVLFMWFVFAVVGMQLFQGRFYSCSNDDFPSGAAKGDAIPARGNKPAFPNGCKGFINVTADDGDDVALEELKWQNADFHFDNIWNGLLSAFIMFTLDGWDEIFFSAVDAVGINKEPRRENNRGVFFFFFVFIFITFLLVYLFVGMIYSRFMYLVQTDGGKRLSSLKQAFWSFYETKLKYIQPATDPVVPDKEDKLKYYMFRTVTSQTYRLFIAAVTAADLVVYLGFAGGGEAPTWEVITDSSLTLVLVLDWVFRLLAYGFRALTLPAVGKLDLFATFIMLAFIGVEAGGLWDVLQGNAAAGLKSLVVIKIVRIVPAFPSVAMFLDILRRVLSSVVPLAAVLGTITFMYAIIGLFFMSDLNFDFVDDDVAQRHYNFKSVADAMLLLFGVATGENWTELMLGLSDQAVPSMRWAIYLYFTTFVVVSFFVVLNMFMLMIIFTFRVHSPDKPGIAMEQVRLFQEAWPKVDRFRRGRVMCTQLVDLVGFLDPPLGVPKNSPYIEIDRHVRQILKCMDYKEDEFKDQHLSDLHFHVDFEQVIVGVHKRAIFNPRLVDDNEVLEVRNAAKRHLGTFKLAVVRYLQHKSGKVQPEDRPASDLALIQRLRPDLYRFRWLKIMQHEMVRLVRHIEKWGLRDLPALELRLMLEAAEEEQYQTSLQMEMAERMLADQVSRANRDAITRVRTIQKDVTMVAQSVRILYEQWVHRIWIYKHMYNYATMNEKANTAITAVAMTDASTVFVGTSRKVLKVFKRRKDADGRGNGPKAARPKRRKFSSKTRSYIEPPSVHGPTPFRYAQNLPLEKETSAIACTRDGKHVFLTQGDDIVGLAEQSGGAAARRAKTAGKYHTDVVMHGHEDRVTCLRIVGNFLYSGSNDGTVRMWRFRMSEHAQIASMPGSGMLSGSAAVFCMDAVNVSHVDELDKYPGSAESHLIVGTSAGKLVALPIYTSSTFINLGSWTPSYSQNTFQEGEDALPVTSIGTAWNLIYTGDTRGVVKCWRYEVGADSSKKCVINKFVNLSVVPLQASPITALVPTGGLLFSFSHDMSTVPFFEPETPNAKLPGEFIQRYGAGTVVHRGPILGAVGNKQFLVSVDESGRMVVRAARRVRENMHVQEGKQRMSKQARAVTSTMRSTSSRLMAGVSTTNMSHHRHDDSGFVAGMMNNIPEFLIDWETTLKRHKEESGVKNTLKRFAKGHPPNEASRAVFTHLGKTARGAHFDVGELMATGLSVGEMRAALEGLDVKDIGGKLMPAQVSSMLDGLNPDGDEFVTLPEFAQWFKSKKDKGKMLLAKLSGRLFVANLFWCYYPWDSIITEDGVKAEESRLQQHHSAAAVAKQKQYVRDMLGEEAPPEVVEEQVDEAEINLLTEEEMLEEDANMEDGAQWEAAERRALMLHSRRQSSVLLGDGAEETKEGVSDGFAADMFFGGAVEADDDESDAGSGSSSGSSGSTGSSATYSDEEGSVTDSEEESEEESSVEDEESDESGDEYESDDGIEMERTGTAMDDEDDDESDTDDEEGWEDDDDDFDDDEDDEDYEDDDEDYDEDYDDEDDL